MEFNMPKDQSSIIKVIGVGGGGSNAVNHMYNQGIKGVDFLVCNTDAQALDASPVPVKIQLGESLTEGRGAGSIPEIGKNAAIENIDDIKEILANNTKMVFVTAGMGGGTGTGAAPVIAQAAKELGILTVAIVTVPFTFEGRKRRMQAEEGLEQLRNAVDTLLVINNDRLREMFGNLSLGNAFSQADEVLATAAKGIAEVISVTGAINVDFNDVNTVMRDSGVAIMGSSVAEGENRAMNAVENALASPLLNDNDISGANYVLLNITYGDNEVLMDEIAEITDYIQDAAGSTADVIWGHGHDADLGDGICITLIATGFQTSPVTGFEKEPEKRVHKLSESQEVKKNMESPTQRAENTYSEMPESSSENEVLEDEPYIVQKENTELKNEETEATSKTLFDNEEKEEKQSEEEVKRYYLEDDAEEKADLENNAQKASTPLTSEEQQKKNQDRIQRIREISSKLKSPGGIEDLENEPAYKRRNINLDDTEHSSDENISRYTLSEDQDENGENKTGLKSNNSFLHDNVD